MAEREQPDMAVLERQRLDLDQAIQAYTAAARGEGIVVDWTLCVEHETPAAGRDLWTFVSPTMTGWKLHGFTHWAHAQLTSWADQLLNSTAE